MAHRADRSYGRFVQRYYRPRYFKVFRIVAWAMILMIVACTWAAAVK